MAPTTTKPPVKPIAPKNAKGKGKEISTGPSPDGTDPFFESTFIRGLTLDTFEQFLRPRDSVIVMFYNAADGKSDEMRHRLVKAAQNTKRHNHAYAAVNCGLEPDLCQQEGIDSTPMFKFYSAGHHMTTIKGYRVDGFDWNFMKKYVEDLDDYRVPTVKVPCN